MAVMPLVGTFSGTTAADASGTGNTGTLAAGAAWAPAGRNGAALALDPVSGLVRVPSASSLTLTSSFTLSAWLDPASLTGYQTALMKETTGNGSYWIQTLDDEIDCGIFDGAGFREHVTAGVSLQAGRWTEASPRNA